MSTPLEMTLTYEFYPTLQEFLCQATFTLNGVVVHEDHAWDRDTDYLWWHMQAIWVNLQIALLPCARTSGVQLELPFDVEVKPPHSTEA